ncbi:MAG: ATP-binding cassette domain-containing protein [bacterium]
MNNNLYFIKNLNEHYTDNAGLKINLFKNISFNIESNLINGILAPKGAGKSALLKIIAGLEEASSGEINIPKEKTIYIPSKPSSFPWLSVRQNIIYGIDKVSDDELKNTIATVGLDGYEDHFPDNKSIGFRFRISLGRAIIRKPEFVLLDEPFGGLEIESRFEIYSLIRNIKQNTKLTFIIASSDINEALMLSDKIYLMSRLPGEIIGELKVDLPVDRNSQLMSSPEFNSIKYEIEKKYQQF